MQACFYLSLSFSELLEPSACAFITNLQLNSVFLQNALAYAHNIWQICVKRTTEDFG